MNPALVADTQGTAMREAYRQFLFGLVSPLGRMFAAELSEKLDEDITLDWTELRASDIAGRARSVWNVPARWDGCYISGLASRSGPTPHNGRTQAGP